MADDRSSCRDAQSNIMHNLGNPEEERKKQGDRSGIGSQTRLVTNKGTWLLHCSAAVLEGFSPETHTL